MPLAGKTRFDLIPFAAVGEIADVLAYGAVKYSPNNWCRGAEWGRYFSALCRHIFAWWRGEDRDPETGFSHLAHAGCCLLFLMEYQRHGWGTDDRFRVPDGEPFMKHDGREVAATARLTPPVVPSGNVDQVCWVGANGLKACAPINAGLHDDDDGLD